MDLEQDLNKGEQGDYLNMISIEMELYEQSESALKKTVGTRVQIRSKLHEIRITLLCWFQKYLESDVFHRKVRRP